MSQCREIRIKSVHNMYYGRFCHFTYENTLKNRDIPMVFIQMVPVPLVTNCIILHMYLLDRVMVNPQYICSFIIHSILPSSPYPYPFPSLSITSFPISLSIHFHFPHFPIPPSILSPHIPPSLHILHSPHILPLIPFIHSYNHVQSTYTDLTPSATRFPTSAHTHSANHVVRSRIHILTFSCSPTNHTSMHVPRET